MKTFAQVSILVLLMAVCLGSQGVVSRGVKPSAIGSSVKVSYGDRQQVQAVVAQDSFYSVSDRRLHFGLGEVDKVDLEVRWPKGSTETLKGLAVDRLVTIREGKGIVTSDKMR